MNWFVVGTLLIASCTWRDSTPGHHIPGDPDAPDDIVHCGTEVFDGQSCDIHTDGLCEWSEGFDSGTPLPVQHCVCRFDGKWKCQTQTYRSCTEAHQTGEACTGEPPCEYPIHADAGPDTDIVCTCVDGSWSCD